MPRMLTTTEVRLVSQRLSASNKKCSKSYSATDILQQPSFRNCPTGTQQPQLFGGILCTLQKNFQQLFVISVAKCLYQMVGVATTIKDICMCRICILLNAIELKIMATSFMSHKLISSSIRKHLTKL